MRFLADLHIHSRFSRATSRDLTLPHLHGWAQRKGIYLVGTGDITHPEWLEEIAGQLEPAEPGLFRLRPDLAAAVDSEVPPACRGEVRFLLQGEISSIYKHDGVVRKVHNLVFCPNLDGARRLLGALDRLGNIRSDGRPILGLSSRHVLEVLLENVPGGHLVPAHVWTPWFSLLGSKSGYDSVEACFGDLAGHINALETGLSSDPAMNWQVSSLDRYALISNSDAHSGRNLGREANEFDLEPGFAELFGSLSPGDPRFLGTIEFHPEEGKYHLDGHRKCGLRMEPAETRAHGGRCPDCGGKLTAGVLNRVAELADRPEGERPPGARPFTSLVPLAEVLGECLQVGKTSKRVGRLYDHLLQRLGPEFHVLRDAPLEEVEALSTPLAAEGLRRMREGELHIAAGYDGEFGTVRLFAPEERARLSRQETLFTLPSGSPSAVQKKPAAMPPLHADPVPAAPEANCVVEPYPPPEAISDLPLFGEPPTPPWLAGLNPEQREAASAPAGPVVIVAGPGTGKTRTLTRRIAHKVLGEGLAPEAVLAVTFTNRAAGELRERLDGLLGEQQAGRIAVSTLHRLGLRILRAEAAAAGLADGFQVLGEDEALALLRGCADLGARDAARLWPELSRYRRLQAGEGAAPPEDPALASLFTRYRLARDAAGAVDLDDLILRPLELLRSDAALRARWQGRHGFLAVDEFQDLDPVQYALLHRLAPTGGDVTVIGDPDQSIYGFRGADPTLFGRFQRDHPAARACALNVNYRSTPTILQASGSMLAAGDLGSGGAHTLRSKLVPFLTAGPRLVMHMAVSEGAEAEHVVAEIERLLGGTSHFSQHSGRTDGDGAEGLGFADLAILYRLRAQRPALEEALSRAGMPYRAVGEQPGVLRERGIAVLERLRRLDPGAAAGGSVADVLAGLELAADHPTARAWRAAAAGVDSLGALLEAVALRTPDDDHDPRAERITLMTLHAAKGLEFPVVFLVGLEEGLVPHLRETDCGEDGNVARLDEERRLLYVGMTRAQQVLHLSWARERRVHGERRRPEASRFLKAIDAALLDVRQGDAGRVAERQLSLL